MKRVICCLDGTWNYPGENGSPTNVVAAMRAIPQVDEHGVMQKMRRKRGLSLFVNTV